jgi:hypothetical protein
MTTTTITPTTFDTLASLLALGLRPDLQGPRVRGSTSEKGIDSLDPSTPAVEFTPAVGAVPVARYFRVETPDIGGRLGAVSLNDLDPSLLPLLRGRDIENHGRELFVDIDPSEAVLPAVDFVTVILGPDAEGDTVWWTWFPGAPTGADLDELAASDPKNRISVKLHNG